MAVVVHNGAASESEEDEGDELPFVARELHGVMDGNGLDGLLWDGMDGRVARDFGSPGNLGALALERGKEKPARRAAG